MLHPFAPNFGAMSTEELNKKYTELTDRYTMALRWNNQSLVGQLRLLMQDYQEEIQNRNRKTLEEMEKNSKNFKNVIDIK
jgi:hypothetical protein